MVSENQERWAGYVAVLVLFLAAVWLTVPLSQGDTVDYAREITDHIHQEQPGGRDSLWEFGHVLWRPLGLLAYRASRPLFGESEPDNLLVIRGLIAISRLAGLGCVLVLYSLLRTLTGATVASVGVTAAFLFSNAFVNYMGTGSAYVPATFFLLLGLRFAFGERRRAWLSGCSLGMAVLIWFPFVLVCGAAVLTPLIWRQEDDGRSGGRMGWAAVIAATCLATLAVGYGFALWQVGAHTPADAKTWISGAGHGWAQNRNALRVVFGIPRGAIEMQDQGRLIKRYLFHDPYAKTGLGDIAGGLVMVAAFYLSMAALLLPLAADSAGRRLLVLLLIASAPMLYFAVFLFEAGSTERFLPVYPFVAMAAAWSLTRSTRFRGVARCAGALLLLLLLLANIRALWPGRASELQAAQQARIGEIRERLRGGGMLAILTNRDALMAFSKTYPFHPLNRPDAVPIYEVLEIGNARLMVWRQDLARRTLKTWSKGGEVWISQRFLADRPAPDWQWVEGDDPRIRWVQVPEFFRTLEFGAVAGGEDGFVLLKDSPANRGLLEALAAQHGKA